MARIARDHHFIPQFLLAGFTPSGNRDDSLWVLDREAHRQWLAKPVSIAFQRDFYMVDVESQPPDVIEKQMAAFEGRAATTIGRVVSSRALPQGDDLVVLVNFIALMAMRTPRTRQMFTEPFARMMKMVLQMDAESPERLAEVAKRAGLEWPRGVSYEELKTFIDGDDYSITFSNNLSVSILMRSVEHVLPLLVSRKWSLLIADPGTRGFVCSDNPVALVWTRPMDFAYGPGFGLAETDVTMALTKDMAMLGRFEGDGRVVPADDRLVATINSRTCFYAQRFIYSPVKGFLWLDADGKIGDAHPV